MYENRKEEDGYEEELNHAQSTMFRAVTARLNYLAQDRSDIQFAVKELCRFMSKPTQEDWKS